MEGEKIYRIYHRSQNSNYFFIGFG
jgi:hypothetical protein